MEAWRAELYHHGIKGQKWGVRRGPPYPLDFHTSSLNRTTMSGLYTQNKQSKTENTKSWVAQDAKNIAEKYDFTMIRHPLTVSEDLKRTNPGYHKHLYDEKWLNNCSHSCVAFAARRRGLDVVATPMSEEDAEGLSVVEICSRYFKGTFDFKRDFPQTVLKGVEVRYQKPDLPNFYVVDFKRTAKNYEKKASAELGKLYRDVPNGGYGMVAMATIYGGHVFVWYKKNGVIKFADSQANMPARTNFEHIARYGTPVIASIRFDNLELDPSRISEAIQSPYSEMRHSIASLGGNFKMEAWREELYLAHHGIKGQKWGIRRFQNKDGTLTDEGKKRKAIYDPVSQFNESRNKYYQAQKQDSDNLTNIGREGLNIGREGLKVYDRLASRKKSPPVDLSSMSDKELQQRINRLNMEQTYRRLTETNDVPKGRQFVDDVLTVGGSALAVTSSALAIALSIKQLRGSM